MAKIKASLKKLTGRVKEMISSFLIQFEAMAFPMAIVVLFFAVERMEGLAFWFMTIAAFLFMCIGFWAFREAVKYTKKESWEATQVRIRTENFQKLNLKLLNDLVEEIRNDRSERNKQIEQ